VPLALTGQDYIELLPADWRAINDDGIQIDYRTYNCPELGPYRRASSGITSRNGRWEVHFDPYDVSRIWVRDHHHGGWITVPWTHQAVVGQPFADFTWRASRKIAAQRGLDDTNEMAVAVILAALLRRAETGPDAQRALARTLTSRSMSNHLPAELTAASVVPESLPAGEQLTDVEHRGPVDAGEPPSAGEPENNQAGAVVPFGIFDPFAEDLEVGR
jgi:hypothetical protein